MQLDCIEKYIFRYNQTSWPGIKKTFLFLSRTAAGRSPGFQLFHTDRLPKSMTDPVTLWSCNAVYSDELRTGFSPVSLFSVKTAPTTSYSIFESLNICTIPLYLRYSNLFFRGRIFSCRCSILQWKLQHTLRLKKRFYMINLFFWCLFRRNIIRFFPGNLI